MTEITHTSVYRGGLVEGQPRGYGCAEGYLPHNGQADLRRRMTDSPFNGTAAIVFKLMSDS